MQRCNELEAELAELRALYESYFMGNERIPPLKQHDAFKKSYLKLKGASVRQTAVKFRIETIGQKLLTFERLWERTLKEIEAGTYKRDLARLKRHQKPKKAGADADFHIDEDLDLSDLESDEGGADDLAAAMAEAEAAAEARAKPPPAIAPTIAPLVPSIAPLKPATGTVPAIKPATGVVPAITPAITPAGGVRPVTTGAVPALTPAGGVKPLSTGVVPALKPAVPAGPPKITAAPAATLPGAKPAVGSNPNLKAPQPGAPVSRPPGTTSGSNPAFKPASSPPVRPPSASGADGGLSDQKVKAIYDAYVMAKKRCGEDTRAVTLDSVASSLRKQVPELMKSHNAKSVEFKVVIKDGKAVLRALPKE